MLSKLLALVGFLQVTNVLSKQHHNHKQHSKHDQQFDNIDGSIDDSSAPFTNGEVETIRSYFESNINYGDNAFTGCVVASPDSTNPNYLYHWQRDAGISMNVLQFTAPNSSVFDDRFQNYVKWVLHVQALDDPNNIDILGEPKFNIDGSVYTGGWCRPQNDGPASRAIALTNYALWLIEQNRTDYVKEYLYTPTSMMKTGIVNNDINNGNNNNNRKEPFDIIFNDNDLSDCSSVGDAARVDCGYDGITEDECENNNKCCWGEIDNNPNNYPWCFYPNQTTPTTQPTTPAPTAIGSDAIKTDLNFVAQNWDQTSNNCDLWEEQTGPHWYTYMVQRHALILGASLAAYFGDDTVASSWNSTAESMISSIQSFDNGTFITENSRQLDCSITVGTLYGGMDNLYPPTDTSVLNTMSAIQDYFANEFAINSEDDSNDIPGVLVGRYANDVYDGCSSDGGSQGHAWILCTNALGDVYYRNAKALMDDNNIINNNEDNIDKLFDNGNKLKIYAKIIKRSFPKASNELIKLSDEWINNKLNFMDKFEIKNNIASYMTTTGDDQLTRIKYHIKGCNFHMSEQICETNGQEIGAYDLTWSYGTFLSAWYYRSEAINAGAFPAQREIDINWKLINSIGFFDDVPCAGCSNQCSD